MSGYDPSFHPLANDARINLLKFIIAPKKHQPEEAKTEQKIAVPVGEGLEGRPLWGMRAGHRGTPGDPQGPPLRNPGPAPWVDSYRGPLMATRAGFVSRHRSRDFQGKVI